MAMKGKPKKKVPRGLISKLLGGGRKGQSTILSPVHHVHRRPETIHTVIQAKSISKKLKKIKTKEDGKEAAEWMMTGVPGLDDMFEKGIPKGSSMLIAGGAGSGKTIMCLQMMAYGCSKGEKCLYLSFEESEERLIQHMRDFGWDPEDWIKKKLLVIKRLDAFEIARSVEALLAKARGELMIEFEGLPGLVPKGFKPDRLFMDSLTAVAAGFVGKDEGYRAYISQMFRMLENLGSTAFLIVETEKLPEMFSSTGVEEFLADGIIALYSIRRDSLRVNAVEVVKLRGGKHEKRVIPFSIVPGQGIVAYPHEEVFASLK
jgi:circadian clock protein KaiC